MNLPTFQPLPVRQRGAASIAIAMLILFILAAAVIGVLKMSGSSVIDAATNEQQVSALFLAESGLERAHALLNPDTPLTTCPNTATGSAMTLGRGQFAVSATLEQITTPSPCTTTAPCYSCVVSSTGTVNATTSRTITQRFGIGTIRGAGTGVGVTTAILKLVNPYNYPVVAFLNVGIAMGGTATKAYTCKFGASSPPLTTCPANWEKWFSVSNVQSNNPGANNFAAGIPLAAYQTMFVQFGFTGDDVYSITGGLFKCLTSDNTNCAYTGSTVVGDTIKGYWKDNVDPPTNITTVYDPSQTGYATTYFGRTNSGFANSATACTTPTLLMDFTHLDSSHTPQVCSNWCMGADTLVFGVAPIMNSAGTDTTTSISSVTFGTDTAGGYPAQNVMMGQVVSMGPSSGWGPQSTPLASFPPSSNPTTSHGYDGLSIYSQVWYAYNPNLSGIVNVSAGSFNGGEMYRIVTQGSTSFTTIGATSNSAGTIFVATAVGSGTGIARHLPFAYNASSYKGNGTGAIGASWTGANNYTDWKTSTITWIGAGNYTTNNGTRLVVGTSPTNPIQTGAVSSVGPGTDLDNGTIITSQISSAEPGGALGGRGVYALSGNNNNVADNFSRIWTLTYTSSTETELHVGTFANYPRQTIQPGDAVSSAGGSNPQLDSGTTIASQISGSPGGPGVYALSVNNNIVVANPSRIWSIRSNILKVAGCSICFIEAGDPIDTSFIAGNKKVGSQLPLQTGETTGGIGRYNLLNSDGTPSSPVTDASVLLTNNLKIGTPGTTIYLPSTPTPSMPPVPPGGVAIQPDQPLTRIAVYSGAGMLQANTTVTNIISPDPNLLTRAFTVSLTPSTPLSLATICAGACAFFNHPDDASAVSSSTGTQFRIVHPSPNNLIKEYSGGFTCFGGVLPSGILPFTQFTVFPSHWTEVVQ